MHLVAGRQKLDTVGASVTAEVGRSPNGQGGFPLDATLRVTLPHTIAPDAARALVEASGRCVRTPPPPVAPSRCS
jgi:hypothetical protein